jgi:ATP-binding cassette subfamily B protein
MTLDLFSLAWPAEGLDEAVERLARASGLAQRAGAAHAIAVDVADDVHAVGRAIESVVSAHGLEVEPCSIEYRNADRLRTPILIRITARDGADEPRLLAVVRSTRRHIAVLGSDHRLHRLDRGAVAAWLREPLAAAHAEGVDHVLDAAAIAADRRHAVRASLLLEQLAEKPVADAWRLSIEPGVSFSRQLRSAGALTRLAGVAALHAVQFGLWLAAWWLVGKGALAGRVDWGWLGAWVLLLATIVPMQLWTSWAQGTLAIAVGRLLKQRLLTGALRLDPERVRTEGTGQLLGRAIESEAVETLAIGGGLQGLLALVELAFAALVLSAGATPVLHVVLLVLITAAAIALAAVYQTRARDWAASRLAMTHDLVERIAGHRTRLAQERRERWHDEEDRSLDDYLHRSTRMDSLAPLFTSVLPRAWSALAIGFLAGSFVSGDGSSTSLAVSVGGILVGALALRHLGDGLVALIGAAVAWRQARLLFDAANADDTHARRADADALGGPATGQNVIDARDLAFRYPSRSEPVLAGCSLRAAAGDRILLEGRSGGGKSTFGAVLAGLRVPQSGLLLVNGIDRATLGPHGWRRRIVAAPQFHENHVLTETFAFNLLMGRRWPPAQGDMTDAETICRELGLGDLLTRMPAGLLQLVGESGWQLSHGERSRLFMARALLQGGDVMIFDESFAALDPENLRQTLECVLHRAPTLLVIAHP